jgi:hypothetical protein
MQRTGGGRHSYAEIVEDNDVLIELKATLRLGDRLVPLIIMSDRTHLLNLSGHKQERPVYMTIGNLS